MSTPASKSGPVVTPVVNYILITCDKPLRQQDHDELKNLGVNIQCYMTLSTILCRYGSNNLEAIKKKVPVKSIEQYSASHKLSAELKTLIEQDKAKLKPAGNAAAAAARTAVTVSIGLHTDVVAAETVKTLQQQNITAEVENRRSGILKARLVPEDLIKLAGINDVFTINEVKPMGLTNNYAKRDIGPYLFTGTGQVVSVADQGFNDGKPSNNDAPHPGFQNNAVVAADSILDSGNRKPDDLSGHGTHVIGTIAGQGGPPGGQYLEGIAPGCKIVSTKITDGVFWASSTVQRSMDDVYLGFWAPRIFNNSWGSNTEVAFPGPYGSECTKIDQFVGETPNAVVIWSAGNWADATAPTEGTIGKEPLAKNVITVGACYSSRNNGNINTMADFSRCGPTPAGRVKPDLVAPGVDILSTVSYKIGGGTGVPFKTTLAQPHDYFRYWSGTSMAAPIVTGCAAVLRQAIGSLQQAISGVAKNANPPASLLKALLINGAVPLNSVDAVPSNKWGFGRVNLQNALAHLNNATGLSPNCR